MVEYNRNHPFITAITERYPLSKHGSLRHTYHVVVSLKNSGLTYKVGDSIGIYGCNDPHTVSLTIKALKANPQDLIVDRNNGETYPLEEFLAYRANISEPSRKFLSFLGERQAESEKKLLLESFFKEENRDSLKVYLEKHQIWDLLEENEAAKYNVQEICNLLMPLLPRFYSIASSQKAVGDEVHLTVALLQYYTNEHLRRGVCTHYLCDLAPVHQPVVPIFIHPAKEFTLPADPAAPMIMIGPGTGIAPFRGFMQERLLQDSSNQNWLFFGEWQAAFDFYYEEFWRDLANQDKVKLSLAFSRDQEHKIYVQDRMHENAQELYQWLENGAYIYVCGDAQRMARDVDAMLHKIVQEQGQKTPEEAKQYVKSLRTQKRYLRDVY